MVSLQMTERDRPIITQAMIRFCAISCAFARVLLPPGRTGRSAAVALTAIHPEAAG
jgi:hypothetical protein